ncbi:MAG: aminoacyl-histidine dipeptidase [Bacteroidales bacterium]|nr:aminoacyl-histidine dipeptidase [Bacteroidales bacterium]
MTIKDLEPKVVWNNFYQLTRIPRPSKHEEKVRQYLLDWGKSKGFETFADKTGNVIIRVPATPGFENRKGVILQGHMDMVPQKNNDTVHDFKKDPIETWVDGEWLRAKGTTLGADNGLGVAMGLSVLEDKSVKHGPIEVLVTYDEETGMTGARALEPGILKGDILINLDSETEGELYVGCAGGLDAVAKATYEPQPWPEKGYACYELAVKGCQGGHSGMDIILCRANANKVAARVLLPLLRDCGAKLIDLEGGTLRNAIPREAFATLYVPEDGIAKAQAVIDKVAAEVRNEHSVTDPNMEFVFKPYECKDGECCDHGDDCKYVPEADALRFVRAILACPDGVDRMSDQMPGLVETSNNMAMVRIEKGEFCVVSLMRSSVDSGKEFLATKLESVFELAGAKVTFEGGYSGWAPNSASPILHTMKKVYNDLYGKEPLVMAIHAGLECGILGGIYPDWDMVSCGPTLLSPHSPDERANIPSVQKAWDFLKAVLENIPEK